MHIRQEREKAHCRNKQRSKKGPKHAPPRKSGLFSRDHLFGPPNGLRLWQEPRDILRPGSDATFRMAQLQIDRFLALGKDVKKGDRVIFTYEPGNALRWSEAAQGRSEGRAAGTAVDAAARI